MTAAGSLFEPAAASVMQQICFQFVLTGAVVP